MGILSKFAKTIVPEEEPGIISGDETRQSRLIFIKNHAKANVTDRSWMPFLILICIIVNIFIRTGWLKIFNVGMLLWMFLAAADSFFKTKEAGLIMRSKPMANLNRALIFLVVISILSIIFIFFDHFVLALVFHSINMLIFFAISCITNRNIEVFLNNRVTNSQKTLFYLSRERPKQQLPLGFPIPGTQHLIHGMEFQKLIPTTENR